MYRLLIVDDEEIITESLYEVFSELKSDQLDVCKAFSGKEALDWLSRTRIDIVLTDIRMPGMDGLELSKKILNYWPRCRMIFLTGFSEFEYAYQAIQMPNVKYLLKTEGYSKVTETVLKVIEEIKLDYHAHSIMEQSQKQLELYELMAQGEYFRYFVQDSQLYSRREAELIIDFERLNINLNATSPVILILGHIIHSNEISYIKQTKLFASLRMIWNTFITDQIIDVGIVDRKGDLLWFLQPSENNDEKFGKHLIRYLEGTLEQIQETCRQTLGIDLSFTMSGNLCEWPHVSNQYERLCQLQQLKVGDGLSLIQIDRVAPNQEIDQKDITRITSKVEILNGYLEAGRVKEFTICFEEITNYALTNELSVQKISEIYYSLSLMLLTYINRRGLYNEIGNLEKLMQLELHKTLEDSFQYLQDISHDILKVKSIEDRDRASLAGRKICEFIQEHLHEDLSLVRLAEIHHFNPSYLSRFFKQEIGMNISEYIDHCRAKKSEGTT